MQVLRTVRLSTRAVAAAAGAEAGKKGRGRVATAAADTMVSSQTDMGGPALPRWDLATWYGYSSIHDEQIDSELAQLEKEAAEFKQEFEGQLSSLLVHALNRYEQLSAGLEKVASYAQLAGDTATNDVAVNKRKSQITQRYSLIEANSINWFNVELAALEEESVNCQLDQFDGARSKYAPFIKSVRKFRPYTLSKEVERALSVRSSFTGKQPVVEHFMRELSYLSFPSPANSEESVNLESLLSKLNNSRSQEYRARVLRTLNDGLGNTIKRDCALSLNCVAGDWIVEKNERGYSQLRSKRNLENDVSDDVVDALIQSTKTKGAQQAKRYYSFKKKLLQATEGISELYWSDRNAPVPIGSDQDQWTWDEAVSTVQSSFNTFSDTFAEIFERLVRERRIDVPAAEGKKAGAYCMPNASPQPGRSDYEPIGPFELLNFTGTSSDVATLAHESGHAVHFALAQKDAGPLTYMPSLPLAETASIYGEEVTFRAIIEKLSPEDRLAKIVEKIDAVINSTVRQVHFDQCEEYLHKVREQGEITGEDITNAFHTTLEEIYGGENSPFSSLREDTGNLLLYVPHFHAVPCALPSCSCRARH